MDSGQRNPPYPAYAGYPQAAQYPPQPSPYNVSNPNAGYPPQPGFYPPPPHPAYPQPQPGFAHPQQPYIPPPQVYPDSADDEPKGEISGWQNFSEKNVRRLFIRKVYSLLLLQLVFTFAIVALFTFSPKVKRFVQTHPALYLFAYISFLVLYIVLACCQSVRRSWPGNMICLALFTISFTYVCATITSQYETLSVVTCFGICATCCLVITLFSFNVKYDLTSWLGILVIVSWCLLLFGLLCIIPFRNFPVMHKVYAGIGAVLFMLFLAVDTQMLMGGKKFSLSPEEHIFATLQLYMDIMYIFIMLLGLFGKRD